MTRGPGTEDTAPARFVMQPSRQSTPGIASPRSACTSTLTVTPFGCSRPFGPLLTAGQASAVRSLGQAGFRGIRFRLIGAPSCAEPQRELRRESILDLDCALVDQFFDSVDWSDEVNEDIRVMYGPPRTDDSADALTASGDIAAALFDFAREPEARRG